MSIAFNGSSSHITMPAGFFNYERTQPWSVACCIYFTKAKSGVLYGAAIFSTMNASAPNAGIEIGLLWTGTSISPNNKLLTNVQLVNNFGGGNRISKYGNTDISGSSWVHLAATYDGSSTAAGVTTYINGVADGVGGSADALSASIITTATRTLGARNASSERFAGEMQQFGAWDAVLNTDEVNSLAKGFSPRSVRPQSLIASAPLIRDIIDIKGNALTATNTSVGTTSPRIYA